MKIQPNSLNPIFVSEHHRSDLAITLKEDCTSRYNLGWICRRHGHLDLKGVGRRGLTRHLITEIASQGETSPRSSDTNQSSQDTPIAWVELVIKEDHRLRQSTTLSVT